MLAFGHSAAWAERRLSAAAHANAEWILATPSGKAHDAAMDSSLRQIADVLLACKSADEVTPRSFDSSLLPKVFVLEIEPDEPLRLRVRLAGTRLNQLFGRRLEGHHIEDFLHGPRGADVVQGFHDCATTHRPLWMRQVVILPGKAPRFVEGVLVFLPPNRIYGGLTAGEFAIGIDRFTSFERTEIAATGIKR